MGDDKPEESGGFGVGIPNVSFVNPIDKFQRTELDIHYNVYELENFGNDQTNEVMKDLIKDLRSAIRLNLTNPTDTTGNQKAQCRAYNRLGIAYYRLLRFNCAEICHRKHLLISQSGDPKDMMTRNRKLNKVEMRISLVNLGTIFHIKGDNELALSAYELAMEKAEELEDKMSQALILGNMSNVHRTLCDFNTAIECEEKRMDILGEIGDVNGQIKCYCSLGSLYQLIGEIRNSLLYYNKAVINLKVKILTLQLEEIGLIKSPSAIGEETGEVETRAS